jgi:hypothetical protein
MEMNNYDAARVLGLAGEITPEAVKTAYRAMSKKYHPDINPSGADMMKLINAAYDALKDYTGDIEPGTRDDGSRQDYSADLNAALNALADCIGLHIEICGAWVWVHGDTFAAKTELKDADFKYASKKKAWFFRPENFRSRNRKEHSMDDIRSKYGTTRPDMRRPQHAALGG